MPVFYHIDLEQKLFFLSLFKPIILQFFFYNFAWQIPLIQYPGRSKQALLYLSKKLYYRIDHNIKRISIILGLFSRRNLLLCDMLGNNYGLLVKTIKKFPKSPVQPAGRVLTFFKHQICSPSCRAVRLQHDRELIMFRLYFTLFMVLLCVIYKSVWHLRTAFWILLAAMFC